LLGYYKTGIHNRLPYIDGNEIRLAALESSIAAYRIKRILVFSNDPNILARNDKGFYDSWKHGRKSVTYPD
jgi:hypothetical protein